MNRKGKVLLPILIVLIIISLALAAGAFYFYQSEHAQNIQLQGQIADLDNRQHLTAGKLEESKKIASELELKLQEAKTRADSLADALAQEKSAHTETLNQLEQYKSDLQQQKSLRQDLENKLKIAVDDGKKINEQMKIIQQQKAQLEEKIKNMEGGESGVELGKVIVNGEATAASVGNPAQSKPKPADKEKADKKVSTSQVKGLEGKIVVVNKEFNFVVINLGSKDNVMVGDEFSVSRDGKPIGDIKIEKVHEAMSAAGFGPELKDLIKENDKITQKAK